MGAMSEIGAITEIRLEIGYVKYLEESKVMHTEGTLAPV